MTNTKKKPYEAPTLCVTTIETEDIIQTSGLQLMEMEVSDLIAIGNIEVDLE